MNFIRNRSLLSFPDQKTKESSHFFSDRQTWLAHSRCQKLCSAERCVCVCVPISVNNTKNISEIIYRSENDENDNHSQLPTSALTTSVIQCSIHLTKTLKIFLGDQFDVSQTKSYYNYFSFRLPVAGWLTGRLAALGYGRNEWLLCVNYLFSHKLTRIKREI